MKTILLGLLTVFAVGQMAITQPAYAQSVPTDDPLELLNQTNPQGPSAVEAGRRLPTIIANMIRIVLSLLGIIFLVLIIYAGFLWMTAGGNEDSVKKAKAILRNSIIGVVIVLLAYAITGFVLSSIITATLG